MTLLYRLSSMYKVVRFRLPVRVSLADDRTRGDFMTKLHNFYLETRGLVRTTNTFGLSVVPGIETRCLGNLVRARSRWFWIGDVYRGIDWWYS